MRSSRSPISSSANTPAGEIDSVHEVYMQFESTSTQVPTDCTAADADAGSRGAAAAAPTADVQYDFTHAPARELLAELMPLSVRTRLFQAFTDAAVSEQVARMVAMKAATDAAGDMIKQLTQAYNRARQTQITLELLDIVSGAEALK